MSEESIQILARATMQQDRRWCIASRYLAPPYAVSTGLAQGCAVSVCSFNCLCGSVLWPATNAWSAMRMTWCLRALMRSSCEKWLTSLLLTCVRWRCGSTLRSAPTVSGVAKLVLCQLLSRFTMPSSTPLAPLISWGSPLIVLVHPSPVSNAVVRDVVRLLSGLWFSKSGKTSWVSKSKAVATLINPMLCYGAWRAKHTKQELRRRRTLIVEAIHGKVGKGARAAEFLTVFFSPVHLMDPFGSLL